MLFASLKLTHLIKEAMNAIERKISDVEKYLALADNEGISILLHYCTVIAPNGS
jgi:hypothetical protein